MTLSELKPCPFCGVALAANDNQNDLYVRRYGTHYQHPEDASCHLSGHEVSPSEVAEWNRRAILSAVEKPAASPATDEKGCNCRWIGEETVQRCEVHEAWFIALHEWADRAKKAEAALAAPAASPAAPVPDGVWEALQRMIENAASLGPACQEDALLVARWRKQFVAARPAEDRMPFAIEGLVWAVAVGDNPEFRGMFDTPQQAHAFVGWLKRFIEPSRAAAPPSPIESAENGKIVRAYEAATWETMPPMSPGGICFWWFCKGYRAASSTKDKT